MHAGMSETTILRRLLEKAQARIEVLELELKEALSLHDDHCAMGGPCMNRETQPKKP